MTNMTKSSTMNWIWMNGESKRHGEIPEKSGGLRKVFPDSIITEEKLQEKEPYGNRSEDLRDCG